MLLQGTRIACIDDHADTLDILRFLFESHGAQVYTASTAAQGFAILSRIPIHVALVDLALPDEDGIALLARIRKLGGFQCGATRVIVLTAYCAESDRVVALNAGASRFIAKPFHDRHLLAAVCSVLGMGARAA